METTERPNVLDPDFRYTTAARTDVSVTWAKYGWTPPNREKQRQEMLRLNPPIVETQECMN